MIMADSSNREVAGSLLLVGISENSTSVVQILSTNSLEHSEQEAINAADTSNREVAGSQFTVGISESGKSAVQLDRTINSPEDSTKEAINTLEQIYKDNGEFVKDRSGRFRVVYNDDPDIDEYKSCIKRVKMKADVNSSEFGEHIRLLLEGIAIQKKKTLPIYCYKR